MDIILRRWLRVSLLNLLIVASIGVVLRYKIAFSLPFIDQKFLLHGHSHFAFSGWITQTLMVLLVAYLSKQTQKNKFTEYRGLLLAHLVTSYGMLVAFPVQGYGFASIAFSTISIFILYFFAVKYWKDLNRLTSKGIVHNWFKAAFLFNFLSSLGTFALAYMMANKIIHQNWYLGAVYFFLHFQYNGWFFFVCMGLVCGQLSVKSFLSQKLTVVFWMFAAACIPAYFLSALWMPIPNWVYVLVVAAAAVQFIAWVLLFNLVRHHWHLISENLPVISKWILGLSALALTVKLLLQLGSTIPALSQLAYGFRPIVIAYLHLVLLGVITLFLLGYMFGTGVLSVTRLAVTGLIIFVLGIMLNEIVLMIQGVAAISYNSIPHTNEILLGIALVMFSGILLVNLSQINESHL